MLQLQRFIRYKSALSDKQFGFRETVGCQEAISYFSNLIYNALDKNKKCLAIFLDIAKAFDSVNHDLLLTKLKSIIGFN